MVLATDSHGNQLIDVTLEHEVPNGHDTVPLTGALVVVTGPDGFLLVHDVWRDQWELAGGGIDQGETSEQAARREVSEESGQQLRNCRRVGSAMFRRATDGLIERADLFCGNVERVMAFEGNDETDAIRWWDGYSTPEQVGAIDAALIRWALAHDAI